MLTNYLNSSWYFYPPTVISNLNFSGLERNNLVSEGESRKSRGKAATSVLKHNSSSQNIEEERIYRYPDCWHSRVRREPHHVPHDGNTDISLRALLHGELPWRGGDPTRASRPDRKPRRSLARKDSELGPGLRLRC